MLTFKIAIHCETDSEIPAAPEAAGPNFKPRINLNSAAAAEAQHLGGVGRTADAAGQGPQGG